MDLRPFSDAYDEFELVAEAADGVAAIGLCASAQPDVILMDLLMPRMDGTTASTYHSRTTPEIQILILTTFKDENLVYEALKAGAISYLLKNITPMNSHQPSVAHLHRGTLGTEADGSTHPRRPRSSQQLRG